jgi:hypothetical protein
VFGHIDLTVHLERFPLNILYIILLSKRGILMSNKSEYLCQMNLKMSKLMLQNCDKSSSQLYYLCCQEVSY